MNATNGCGVLAEARLIFTTYHFDNDNNNNRNLIYCQVIRKYMYSKGSPTFSAKRSEQFGNNILKVFADLFGWLLLPVFFYVSLAWL